MKLTLAGRTALGVLRAQRAGLLGREPVPSEGTARLDSGDHPSLSRGRIERAVFAALGASVISPGEAVELDVPSPRDRVRARGVSCRVCSRGLPEGAFLELGGGMWASSPELLFVETAATMAPVEHLVLGLELCGTFALNPLGPRSGSVTYGVEPATSIEKRRGFMDELAYVRGKGQARHTLDLLVENAWSPMEAIVAALCLLPCEELGYDLWPLELNSRVSTAGRVRAGKGTAAENPGRSRVPDIVFKGTGVGLNYDGENHLDLRRIVTATKEELLHPGSASAEGAIDRAIAEVRGKAVDDRRRDRELGAQGMTVMVVTYEDLLEKGALDDLMLQVMLAIEHTGRRDLSYQRGVIESGRFEAARQDLVWSLLPTADAAAAADRVRARFDPAHESREVTGTMRS